MSQSPEIPPDLPALTALLFAWCPDSLTIGCAWVMCDYGHGPELRFQRVCRGTWVWDVGVKEARAIAVNKMQIQQYAP